MKEYLNKKALLFIMETIVASGFMHRGGISFESILGIFMLVLISIGIMQEYTDL